MHKNKSLPAHPFNCPFAGKHMLFLPTRPLLLDLVFLTNEDFFEKTMTDSIKHE